MKVVNYGRSASDLLCIKWVIGEVHVKQQKHSGVWELILKWNGITSRPKITERVLRLSMYNDIYNIFTSMS